MSAGGDGQVPEPVERVGELMGPGPVVLDVEMDPAGVADDPCGGVQQLVTRLLGFGGPQLARLQDEQLGEGHQVLSGQYELEPQGVTGEGVARQGPHPGVFAAPDAVLHAGVAAVAGDELGEIVIAPIDPFGVGTRAVAGLTPPGFVYKLTAIDGVGVAKASSGGKATVAGAKNVWRLADGTLVATVDGEPVPAGATLALATVWDTALAPAA